MGRRDRDTRYHGNPTPKQQPPIGRDHWESKTWLQDAHQLWVQQKNWFKSYLDNMRKNPCTNPTFSGKLEGNCENSLAFGGTGERHLGPPSPGQLHGQKHDPEILASLPRPSECTPGPQSTPAPKLAPWSPLSSVPTPTIAPASAAYPRLPTDHTHFSYSSRPQWACPQGYPWLEPILTTTPNGLSVWLVPQIPTTCTALAIALGPCVACSWDTPCLSPLQLQL